MKKIIVGIIKSNDALHGFVRRLRRKKAVVALKPNLKNDVRLKEFLHFYKLKNYRSASGLLSKSEISGLRLSDQLLAIRSLYGSCDGVSADDLLESAIQKCMESSVASPSQLAELAGCVRSSGLQFKRKLFLIHSLEQLLVRHSGEAEGDRFKIKVALFRIKAEADVSTSLLDFIDLGSCSVEIYKDCAGAFPLFFSYGYHDHVYAYLNRCLAVKGISEVALLRIVLRFMPEWFDGQREAFFDFVSQEKNDFVMLQAIYPHRGNRDYFEQVASRCLESVISKFDNVNPYKKDAVLRFLFKYDFWETAERLIYESFIPDEVLTKWIFRGFRYLNLGDYGAALHCFQRVLLEDPSDGRAALGLRFTMPRTGFGMGAALEMRAEVGYGIESSGRKGMFRSRGDYSSSKVMSGDYLASFYGRRSYKHWKMLEAVLGGRFYSFYLPPVSVGGDKVYIIADEGVGDEIRASQFYGYLQSRYGNLIATCDPRLLGIYSNSFPSIRFIPVRRVRKIMATRAETQRARLVGVHEIVSKYFDSDAYSEMLRSDHVLFGQNLIFHSLLGTIPRPRQGGYLKWHRGQRIGVSSRLKIGILWRSHLMVGVRKLMYLRIEDFAPLTDIEGVEIWSIQHAMTEAETQTCRELGINLLDDVDLFNDFEGMAGCLLGLDLLIGISSVPMELGAALGIETWMLGFSPENYYLRTAGGKTEVDQLTLNSTVIAPPWIDFTEPQEVCVREVFEEVKRRLAPKLAVLAEASTQVCEG